MGRKELLPRQKRFCQLVVAGSSLVDAYIMAYQIKREDVEKNKNRYSSYASRLGSRLSKEIARLQKTQEVDLRKEFKKDALLAYRELVKIIRSKQAPSVKMMAIKDLLDRAGYKPVEELQVRGEEEHLVIVRPESSMRKEKLSIEEGERL